MPDGIAKSDASTVPAPPPAAERRLIGGAGDGTYEGMEPRLIQLETALTDIRIGLARIEAKLDGMPSGQQFGEMKGRVDALPTTATMSTLIGLAVAIGGVVANAEPLLRHWGLIP